jgi:hypothetical protein
VLCGRFLEPVIVRCSKLLSAVSCSVNDQPRRGLLVQCCIVRPERWNKDKKTARRRPLCIPIRAGDQAALSAAPFCFRR